MICPVCKVEGRGPRFARRHPSLCQEKIKEALETKKFTHQLAGSERTIWIEESEEMTVEQWNTARRALERK